MVDWFTVVAQIVNFLILIALLRYFLYGRIMRAMAARQEIVESHWDEAKRARQAAEIELAAAQEKNQQINDEREADLEAARNDVEAQRQQLTARVREEIDDLRARWSKSLQEEQESFLRDLRTRTCQQVCAMAEKALSQLASASLEDQIIEHFVSRIRRLEDQQARAVVDSIRVRNRCVVRTGFALTDTLQRRIKSALGEKSAADIEIQFEQSSDLVCGVSLQADSQYLAWNLRDYLTSLEQEILQAIEEQVSSKRLAVSDVATSRTDP